VDGFDASEMAVAKTYPPSVGLNAARSTRYEGAMMPYYISAGLLSLRRVLVPRYFGAIRTNAQQPRRKGTEAGGSSPEECKFDIISPQVDIISLCEWSNLNQPPEFGAILLSPTQNINLTSGTIIVLYRDNERFIVIADSRLSSNDQPEYRDTACKLNALGDKAFFFATGRTLVMGLENESVLDVNAIAVKVFRDFSGKADTNSTLHAIAFYTAISLKALFQDIAAQDAAHLFAGVHKDNLMQMIIGGTTDSRDLIAYCIQIKIQANEVAPYPLIVFTVERWNPELGIFGSDEKDGFMELMMNDTERAKIANEFLAAELAKLDDPDTQIFRLKARVQTATDWAKSHRVGGPLDILELRKGGYIRWIQRKSGCK
jgi:hypothetical protein